MARVLPLPRKQRTRQHVIADLAVNHVERFVFEAGFTAERMRFDYGYDLTVVTYDSAGYVEPECAQIQVKATEHAHWSASGDLVFDISVLDYNLWTSATLPVFLVVFEAMRRRAYWIYVQQYFRDHSTRKPRKNATSVRVLIPKAHRVNRKWVVFARKCKDNVIKQMEAATDHG
jgi:hypothetical protein